MKSFTEERKMGVSTSQILRVLFGRLQDVPALIAAVKAIADADGISDKIDAVKRLMDLLKPILVELAPLVGTKEPELFSADPVALDAAGIGYDDLMELLPVIQQIVAMALKLFTRE